MSDTGATGAGPGSSAPAPEDRADAVPFAALLAHQLRAPVHAAASLLQTLLGEFAGPLSPRQRDLVQRADRRLAEAAETVRRLLTIARRDAGDAAGGPFDLAALVRRMHHLYVDEAAKRRITLSVDIRVEPAPVRAAEDLVAEALRALIANALKYTPDHGQVRLLLAAEPDGTVRISVADSGIGVPADQRRRIFEPFVRGTTAHDSARPGLGVGLAFVKAVFDGAGGAIEAGSSDLGGAEFTARLPAAADEAAPGTKRAEAKPRFRVVIVGGVAAGPKVASKVIRLRPETEVTVLERGAFLSYAGCGLPYYIAGVVREQRELLSTPLGAVRDPVFFQNVRNVTVRSRTEALAVDREGRRVRVVDRRTGHERWLPYDRLVLATGATPIVPEVPGRDLPGIYTLHGVHDAEGIRASLAEGRARDVVIVGGGLIAVEMTKALALRGCRLTVIEKEPRILRFLDAEIARLVERHLEANGVRVLTETRLLRFEGESAVRAVVTDRGSIPVDLVVLGAGVRPASELARAAGLELGVAGAIRVDDRMRTTDPDIYAVGDCVETRLLPGGEPGYIPLGSTANRQGRTAAVNLCGGDEVFPGVTGTMVCQVFDYAVGRTGLSEREAREAGRRVVTALHAGPDREHFLPEARPLMLKLIADADDRRLLGLQAIGPGQGDKRIDVAATAITAGMTIDAIAQLDLGYAPPFSPAMDNLITAANIAKNKLAGNMPSIAPVELKAQLDARTPLLLLDVSSPGEYARVRLPDSRSIPLGALRGRLGELPRDRPIVTLCANSIRGYEAALILRAAGFPDVRVLDGGLAMWPYALVHDTDGEDAGEA